MTDFAQHAIALEFYGVALHWYGLAYLVSFLWIGGQSKRLLRRNDVWGCQESPLLLDSVPVLVASLALGVVGGARLGSLFEAIGSGVSASNAVTLGGMSSFGAFAGALLALSAFSRVNRAPLLSTLDLVAFSAPGCILLIRVANFVNGDLIGVPVQSTWASTLLGGAQQHPVALYEAIVEGLIPLLLLRICVLRRDWLSRPGAVTGLFALFYAVARGSLIAFRDVSPGSVPLTQDLSVLCCTALAIAATIMLFVAWKRFSERATRVARTVPAWHGSWLAEVACVTVVIAVSLPLTACKKGSQSPSSGVTIVYSNPGADPQCTCANSTGAYAQNTSDTARQVSWTVNAKDTFTGHQEAPASGSASVGPNGQKTFLGCSIYAPSNQCRYQAVYELNQAAALRTNVKRSAAVFGAVDSPSIASCKTSCGNPNDPVCLPLGVRYYQAVAPLGQMVEVAQKSGGNVSKADIIQRYHLRTSDDKCERGDIKTAGGQVVNDGVAEYCVISSADLPTRVLSALNLDSLEGTKPLRMNIVLPRHIVADPEPSIRALDASNILVFKFMASAPFITFEGAGGAKLTHDFGGSVLGAAEIKPPGGQAHTIVATQNGCLSVDEP